MLPGIPEVKVLETSANCTLQLLSGPVCKLTAMDYFGGVTVRVQHLSPADKDKNTMVSNAKEDIRSLF